RRSSTWRSFRFSTSSSRASDGGVVTRPRRRVADRGWSLAAAIVAQGFSAALVSAQPPAPAERITFQEAITRAVDRNPSSAVAAAGIIRAEGLLVEARSAIRPQVNGFITTTTLNSGIEFAGQTVSPQNSVVANLDVRGPILAAAQWARRTQAE